MRQTPTETTYEVVKKLHKRLGRLRLRTAAKGVRVETDISIRSDQDPRLVLSYFDAQGEQAEWSCALDRTSATDLYRKIDNLLGLLVCLNMAGRLYTVLLYEGTYYGEQVRFRVTGHLRMAFSQPTLGLIPLRDSTSEMDR